MVYYSCINKCLYVYTVYIRAVTYIQCEQRQTCSRRCFLIHGPAFVTFVVGHLSEFHQLWKLLIRVITG